MGSLQAVAEAGLAVCIPPQTGLVIGTSKFG